ncbi:MAG: glycoside hydrolase family protein [Firmicutes bacterium]|nr:glycoside hydrolase family protein [Bacillota bacterium]
MFKIDLNKDWDFYESNEGMSFIFGKPESKKINLPHDFIINKGRSASAAGGPANGYFLDGEGVYKKRLDIPKDWEGKTVLLDIDGAYMNLEVALNGEVLAMHPYGYTPFQVDLTKVLRFNGKSNNLKILTQSRQPSSRWYSGGGLYRSIALWVGDKIHIKPWELFVTTPIVKENEACVNFQMKVTNSLDLEKNVTLICEIKDQNEKVIAEKTVEKVLISNGDTECYVNITVKNPQLWNINNPYLYSYQITIQYEDKYMDSCKEHFGIRSTEVDAQNGFRLNGKPMKLKGGCIHHDNGFLGACAYPKAEERKIRILKKAGYNAVRISHYPPSLALLNVCDRLGMLVLDEAFDVWRMSKMPLDYHLYFENWWDKDIEYMVKRDRNHPCVISYSIGNEIVECDGRSNGAIWAKKLSDKVREFDDTRFVMAALCQLLPEDGDMSNFEVNLSQDNNEWAEKTKECCSYFDIVGYNYLKTRYEKDHLAFPKRVMLGSESYGFTTYEFWREVEKHPYVIGDFIWTAVDYLGEVGIGKLYWKVEKEPFCFMGAYPWRSAWVADIDLTGEQRPQSHYREIMWGNKSKSYLVTTHPKHTGDEFFGVGWYWYDVSPCWTFAEEYIGKVVKVDVYGGGDEAEFILNGKSIGKAAFEKLIATLDIPYEPGCLEAVVYESGEVISRSKLETAGSARNLVLYPEEDSFAADGLDLCYVRIHSEDEYGNRVPFAENEICVKVSDEKAFFVVGSGNPCTEDQIGDYKCHLYNGSAIIILKTENTGKVEIEVLGSGLKTGYCSVAAI